MANVNIGAPITRLIIAGAGLVGGGSLAADRTFDAVAADASIVVTADAIAVGVLQTDAMHGVRGGATQHALATGSVHGFMSSTDKTKLDTYPATPGAFDHDTLNGLGDDDHTQYHTDARGDARYYQKSEFINTSAGAGDAGKPIVLDAGGLIAGSMLDHGVIGGLGDDDHTQYHNNARGDARYFQQSEFIQTSTGVPDGGKPIILDANGAVSGTMLNPASIDHGALSGRTDDDHPQYLLVSGTRAMTGNLLMGANAIQNTSGVEFSRAAANPGDTAADTLYQDDGSNFEDGTLWWGNKFVVDGEVSIGDPGFEQGSIAVNGGTFNARLKVNDFGGTSNVSLILHRHSTTDGPEILHAYSNTDDDTHAIVSDGDSLGGDLFAGHDGVDYNLAASILCAVDGTPAANDMPGRIVFSVSPSGSNVPVEAMRISQDKSVLLAGNTTWNSASPTLTIGDGTSSLITTWNKGASSSTELTFKQNSLNAWIVRIDGSEDVLWRRYIAGAFQDNALSIANATGDISIPNQLLLAGAAATDAATTTDDIIVGDGGAVDRGMAFFVGESQTVRWAVIDSVGGADMQFRWALPGTLTLRLDNADRFTWSTTQLYANSLAALGTNANRWGSIYGTALYLGGGIPGDAVTGSADGVIGAIEAADHGITIVSGIANVCSVAMTDTTGGAAHSGITHDHNTNIFSIWANGASRFQVSSLYSRPTATDTYSLGTTGRRWTDIWGATLYLSGALDGNGVTGATDIVFGDGSGDVGLTGFIDASGTFAIEATDTSATSRGKITYADVTPRWTFTVGGGGGGFFGSTRFSPNSGGYHFGSTGTRFGDLFATNLYFGGGLAADATTGAADAVIGAIEAADHGITIVSGTANTGYLAFTDTTGGTSVGLFGYDHDLPGFRVTIQNTLEATWTGGRLAPASAGAQDLGTVLLPFGEVFAQNVLVAGAETADGVTNATDLIIGDGSGEHGLTIFADAASTVSGVYWTGTSGTDEASFVHDLASKRFVWRSTSGTGRMTLETNRLQPGSDGVQALARTQTSGWAALSLTERADHFGTPTATRAEVWLINTATQSLMFTDDAGADWKIGGDTQTANQILLAGAAAVDGHANYDELIIGDGAATARGLTFYIASGTYGGLAWNDGNNTNDGVIEYNGVGFRFRANAVNRMALDGNGLQPTAGQSLRLGLTQTEGWSSLALTERADHVGTPTATRGEVWLANTDPQSLMLTDDDGNDWQIGGDTQTMNTLLVAGASVLDADASANDIVVGAGDAVARGITFVGTTASDMSIAYSDGTLLRRGEIRFENSATPDRVVFRIANVDRMALDTTFFSPTTDGALGVGDVTSSGWNSLALTQRSDHVGTPTSTRGEVWLRSETSSPHTLCFTDHDGGDHPLSLMEILHGSPTDVFAPGVGMATFFSGSGGEAGRAFWRFSAAATNTVYWRFVMPRDYTGGGVTVRLYYFGSSAFGATDSVYWSIGFERQVDGLDTSTTSFGNFTDSIHDPGVTSASILIVHDITIASGDMDSIALGEAFMITVDRLGANGSDDYSGTTGLFGISILQDPQ